MRGNIADKISDAELAVVQAVWELGGPATFAAIREVVSRRTSWGSPSTLNTLIGRLVKKGILVQQKREVYEYTCTVTEQEYRQAKTQALLQNVYGGSVRGLVSTLIGMDGVPEDELRMLERFWREGGEGDA